MEEIKDNEYVRTLQGTIAKIEDSEFDVKYKIPTGKPIYRNWKEDFGGSYVAYEDIVKHSFNIIDLIEVRDYVNGYMVIDIDRKNNKVCLLMPFDENNLSLSNIVWKVIKPKDKIVTKEQFKSIEYEVK